MESIKNLRAMYIAKILYEQTDDEHPISTNELIHCLEEKYGIKAHRVTIYEDIQQLKAFGLDIFIIKSTQNKYYLGNRLFDLPELKLLVDAVESSKFITPKKSQELVEKIGRLASKNKSIDLQRNLCPEGRIKPVNEKIYYIVDTIHSAINSGKKIAFPYFFYTADKQQHLRHDGEAYVFSPWMLVWNGDYYYMLGWYDKKQLVASFRVDRIASTPEILDEDAVPPPAGFDPAEHVNSMFNMFTSERIPIKLLCDNDTIGTIIDRFGENVKTEIADENHFIAHIDHAISHVFFCWIFGFGGKVRIISPDSAISKYKELLQSALENCQMLQAQGECTYERNR